MKTFKLLFFVPLGAVFAPTETAAQTYPYRVDFESANTKPSSKAYASLDTITVDSVKWIMPGVFLGGAVAGSDFFRDARSARVRMTNNTTGDPGYLEMVSDLPDGVGTVALATAMWKDELDGKLLIYYSTDQGYTWLPAGDTIEVPPNAAPQTFTRNVHRSGDVRIKIAKVDAANTRINIDDIEITKHSRYISIISATPNGVDVPLGLTELKITFDEDIVEGQGKVILHNQTNGTQQSIDILSSSVTVSDSTATISGFSLENASTYFVNMDSAAFYNLSGTKSCAAIIDPLFWAFSTVDTTGPPPLTSLNESFTDCDDDSNMLGMFFQYSKTGKKTWVCSSVGHTDTSSIMMNGGYAIAASEENEDWLISRSPFDLSGMDAPSLSFWQKSRYSGTVERKVRISTSFSGKGDPNDAGWIDLDIPEIIAIPAPTDTWKPVRNVDLSAYKSQPFYLAFTYSCSTGGAWELSYDDIVIEDVVKVLSAEQSKTRSRVIGQTTNTKLTLEIPWREGTVVDIEIIDMAGRKMYQRAVHHRPENQIHEFNDLNLTSGMHLIRIRNHGNVEVLKTVIR